MRVWHKYDRYIYKTLPSKKTLLRNVLPSNVYVLLFSSKTDMLSLGLFWHVKVYLCAPLRCYYLASGS